MRTNVHIEEIRHLYDEHIDLVLALAQFWVENGLQHSPGDPLPSEFETFLEGLLFPSDKGDPHEWRRPLDKVVVQSGRTDEGPPDAGESQRQGRAFPVQKRYRKVDKTIPEVEEPLMVTRHYPGDKPHQELVG